MTRLERLEALLDEFSQSVDDYDEAMEEDLRPYFDPKADWDEFQGDRSKEPAEWCCVTQNGTPGSFGDKAFFLPMFDTRHEAMARAVEFIDDDTFTELPVAVVNLDTGERHVPRWASLQWHKAK